MQKSMASIFQNMQLPIANLKSRATYKWAMQQNCHGPDNTFDLVISITTLHNLYAYDLDMALREIERVGKHHKYVCVESYRNEEEKANLLYWQVTCEAFNTPEEWRWWFKQTNYSGDYSFIYFE